MSRAKADEGNLSRACRKIHPNSSREWCGYLTPSEILVLLKNGARQTSSHPPMDYVKQKKKNGDSRPTWFYFTLKGLNPEKFKTRKRKQNADR